MIKKVFATALIAVSSVALLSGCVTTTTKTDNIIKLDQSFDIKTVPQWDESSLKELQKAGWTINEQQRQAMREENIAIPQGFYATNPEADCFVSYNIFVTNVAKPGASEDYITREEAYRYSDGTNPKAFEEGTANISIAGSPDKLEMIKLIFAYENKVSKPMSQEEAAAQKAAADATGVYPEPSYTVDGEIHEAYMTRVTANTVDNPMYEYIQKQNKEITSTNPKGAPQVERKGNAVIEMKYACKKKEIDVALWDKLVKDAKINFNPLPATTGAAKQ